jgi:exodeoxyribonuclease-1
MGYIEPSFFFYDLETSGLNPRADRIMQFAGQRTSLSLEPIGEPVNLLVKLSDDTLPNPYAIMTTGITPQMTLADGVSEAELAKFLAEEVFTPGTVAVGFNSVRFDDEFMRCLMWRNFHDAYEWAWKDGRSRWDLLDVVRLTRALRPEGINWPVTEDGKETNRLELMTELNGISHEHAHDALSDVEALIGVTRLIKEKQPQLYDWLFRMRDKRDVLRLVNLDAKKPFVYASGRYASEHHKTTVAFPLAAGRNGNILVFDLRYNLDELLAEAEPKWWPIVKEFAPNKCPAVAPLSVLERADGWSKIHLDAETVEKNLSSLLAHPEFAEQMRAEAEARDEWPAAVDVESALYDGFLGDGDRAKLAKVRAADVNQLADLGVEFADVRLDELLLHYKGRNYPQALSADEAERWEAYRVGRLRSQSGGFLRDLEAVAGRAGADEYLVEELKLYYESVAPIE